MALEGTLQDMSLVDLFQIFDAGLKTGILELNATAHQATICISQGQPIDATVFQLADHSVLATGEAAVFELLQWSDASFCFEHDPLVRNRTPHIFRDSATLVAEGMQRKQEAKDATAPAIITPESYLRMATPTYNIRGDINLDLTQWRILSQIAIANNIREICTNTGLAIDNILRVTSDLARLGLVEVVREPAHPAPHHKPRAENPFCPASVIAPAMPAPHAAPRVQPGKTLLKAIMRRVRGL